MRRVDEMVQHLNLGPDKFQVNCQSEKTSGPAGQVTWRGNTGDGVEAQEAVVGNLSPFVANCTRGFVAADELENQPEALCRQPEISNGTKILDPKHLGHRTTAH